MNKSGLAALLLLHPTLPDQKAKMSSPPSTALPTTPAPSLAATITNESALDLVVAVGDVGLDAAISSGALDGVPILGLITGGLKAGKSIREQLYVRQVARFLGSLQCTTAAQRADFINRLRADGELQRFGETILLLLDQSDDVIKATIIGRMVAAHIVGAISYEDAMRLSAMVNRAYASDFTYLKTFAPGVQPRPEIAHGLESAGLLSTNGLDAGNIDAPLNSGGVLYKLNRFGDMLLAHGLS